MRAATLFSSTTMAAATIMLLFSSQLVDRTSAFHPTAIGGLSSSPTIMANAAVARVVSTELHYASSADDYSNINNFSELDKLRAKRKNLLRRPSSSSTQQQQQPSSSAMPSKKQGLEYLYDQSEERHADDFFHVILMPSTFTKNQVSIEHATESILSTLLSSSTSTGEEYTYTKIRELTTFTKHQVFTLLGTWTRSECLEIGHQLQEMDLDVRVIPYSEGLLEMNMNTAAGIVASSSPSSPPMRTSSSPQLSSLPSPSLLEESSRGDDNDDTVVVVGRSSRRSSAASSSSDYLLSL